jgi:hypothetical protein
MLTRSWHLGSILSACIGFAGFQADNAEEGDFADVEVTRESGWVNFVDGVLVIGIYLWIIIQINMKVTAKSIERRLKFEGKTRKPRDMTWEIGVSFSEGCLQFKARNGTPIII